MLIIMPYLKSFCLLLLLRWTITLTVADFKPALFHTSRPSGFYQVTTGIDNTGLVLGFGDFNGDKYTDYIASDDLKVPTLTIFLWSESNSVFIQQTINLTAGNFSQVAEAMICDVDSDGLPEIVVTYLYNGTYNSQIYDVSCSTSTCQVGLQSLDYSLLSNMTALPFLVDIDGSGHISFFTFNTNARNVLQYNRSATTKTLHSVTFASLLVNPSQTFNPISLHFASMIDLNGDCSSDLVIVSNSGSINSNMEIYIKSNKNYYQQVPSLSFGKNITWLTFADLDSNGAVDLFIVALEDTAYKPYAILNPYVPGDICAASTNSPFSVSGLQPIILPTGYSLTSNSNIKFADINFDGLPDMVGLFTVGKFKRASTLVNNGALSFYIFEGLNVEEITSIDNPVQACVFDFSENGKVDIIVVNQVTTEAGAIEYVRTSIVNNIIDDSLFIKILPLLVSSSDFDSNSINAAIGVTVQWRITNLNGDKTIALLNQKSQWNYGTLQLPFVTGGLGRTNNYIEDLAVGYPGRGEVQTWTPIIPNSQLMVRREVDEQWDLQTLLKDNSRVYDVIYISIICLMLLGVVVFYLNWRQSQEDKRDHYNFIQMIR